MTETLIREVDIVVREVANLDLDDADLTPGSQLLDEGFIDSMKFVKVVLNLEKKFGVKFTDAHLAHADITTVTGLARVIAAVKV